MSFSPGGDLLASGSSDTTGLIWDVTGHRKGGHMAASILGSDDLDRLWSALADDKAAEAWDAIWTLAMSPKQSLPFLKARLLPRLKADVGRLAALVRDLDADEFEAREKATETLRSLGEAAESYLRGRLKEGGLTPEADRRLREVLHDLDERSREGRRLDRVFAVLERMTDGGAKDLVGAASKKLQRRLGDPKSERIAATSEEAYPLPLSRDRGERCEAAARRAYR